MILNIHRENISFIMEHELLTLLKKIVLFKAAAYETVTHIELRNQPGSIGKIKHGGN